MDAIKRIFAVILVLLLLAITVFCVYFKVPSLRLAKMIESESIGDLSLTIYYMKPSILTFLPVTVDALIDWHEDQRIIIYCNDLEEHIDLFKQISNKDMKPKWNKTPYKNIRLYYLLESEKNGKLFDVAMWGYDESMYVNGIEVMGGEIFYDVIIPFMPEDVIKDWEDSGIIGNGKSVEGSHQ